MIPIVLTTVIAAAPGAKEAAGKNDSLDGKWQVVQMEEKGLPAVEPDELMTLTVKGGEMLFQRGTDKARPVTFVVDTSKSPAHLDLKLGPDHVCHAIFRVDKEELVICAGSSFDADEPADRPRELVTGPSDERPQKGKLLFRYKRIK